jgi:hypothetical protein
VRAAFLLTFEQVERFQLNENLSCGDLLSLLNMHLRDTAADARTEPDLVGFDETGHTVRRRPYLAEDDQRHQTGNRQQNNEKTCRHLA